VESDRIVTVNLPRFGTCSYRESEVLDFPGVAGLRLAARFIALNLEGQALRLAAELDDPAIALPAADPGRSSRVRAAASAYATSSLQLAGPRLRNLCCGRQSRRGRDDDEPAGPIVVNLCTRRPPSHLETGGYSVRTPIPRKASAATAEPRTVSGKAALRL